MDKQFFNLFCFQALATGKRIVKPGKKQSPIDIKGATQDKALGAFTLINYDRKMDDNFTVFNNGHGLESKFSCKVLQCDRWRGSPASTQLPSSIFTGEKLIAVNRSHRRQKKYAAEVPVNSISLFFSSFLFLDDFFHCVRKTIENANISICKAPISHLSSSGRRIYPLHSLSFTKQKKRHRLRFRCLF